MEVEVKSIVRCFVHCNVDCWLKLEVKCTLLPLVRLQKSRGGEKMDKWEVHLHLNTLADINDENQVKDDEKMQLKRLIY